MSGDSNVPVYWMYHICPQYALYPPFIAVIMKLPLLLPPVDNYLQKIRRGYERGNQSESKKTNPSWTQNQVFLFSELTPLSPFYFYKTYVYPNIYMLNKNDVDHTIFMHIYHAMR